MWCSNPALFRLARLAGFLLLLLLGVASAGARWRQVFASAPGRVALADGDCYARMTRAREVFLQPGKVVRAHGFENFPAGVRPHTTAPLDYGIAAPAWLLRAAGIAPGERALDLAGAWISPLLGASLLGWLWLWMKREQLPGRGFALGVAALSPILAHGFALGRPDHQAPALVCVGVALAAEASQWRKPSRGWALASGAAWGLGLWISLYEPAVLLGGTLLAGALLHPAALWRRERLPALALGGGVLLFALWCEGGWRLEPPGRTDPELFTAWKRQIGELRSVPPWDPLLYCWNGLGLLAAPALLLLARHRPGLPDADARLALGWLAGLALVFALTCWQVRWGYFLVLVGVLSLPWQSFALAGRSRRVRGAVLAAWLLGLTPMLGETAGRLRSGWRGAPGDAEQARETLALEQVANFLKKENALEPAPAGGVLAPWWLSPALAYWSGVPAVAGSSHESLPGTADVARFFLAPAREPAAALVLLRARRVRWVVVDDPARTLPTSAGLLGRAPPPDALGAVLAGSPERAPGFLRLAYANPFFKVYAVNPVYLGGS